LKVSLLEKLRELMQLRRAVDLVWKSTRNWTVMSLGCMVVQAVLPLMSLYLIKLIVDAVQQGINAPGKSETIGRIFLWIALAALVILLTAGFRALSDIIRENQSQLLSDHITDVIHAQSAEVDLVYYEDPDYYDTLHRAQQEAPYRPNHIIQALTQLGQNVIALIALAGLLFYLHWVITLVLFIAVLPAIVVKIRNADRLYEWKFRQTETERRTYLYHYMLTSGDHAKEMRLFDLGNVFRQRYRDLRETLRRENLHLAKIRSLYDLSAQVAAIVALFGLLVFVVLRTIRGELTLGDMVMYYGAFQRAQTYLQDIMGGLAGLYEDSIFLNYFYKFLDLKSRASVCRQCKEIPHPMKAGIKFNNVSFMYNEKGGNVLEDIDLTIKPGEVVALVGDNGAGKTTLAKLLCRLYEPTVGRIILDGTDFRDFDIKDLRREIAIIFQDYIHYPLTARENIWVGDISLKPNDERVQSAAQFSGADGFISQLPDGYETILGKHFTGGVEISIGEWQKVALARAFLRDAQLIILDEPTSSMSPQSEYEVFQSFRKLMKGRSALLISHRFSTVRMADTICVLEKGKIVERGSHQELIRLGGYYARLYEIQAQHYR
jgi:ATP-binding cassette subfamily B protein